MWESLDFFASRLALHQKHPFPCAIDRSEDSGVYRHIPVRVCDNYFVTAIYVASEKYKLVEEYGLDSFKV